MPHKPSSRTAGGPSPKHRGQRPAENRGKARWSTERRAEAAQRRAEPASRDARPDWTPPGLRPKRNDRTDRPARGFARPDRRERGDRTDRYERTDRTDRGQRSADRDQRSDRFDRPERGDRNDRFERSDRPNRGERPQRSDRGDRFDRGARDDRSDRFERPERRERSERVERSDRSDRFDRTGRPARQDRNDRFDRPERRDRTDRFDRPARTDRPERRERNDRFDRNDRPARMDRDRSERPAPIEDVVLERLEAQAHDATESTGVGFAELGLGQNIVRALSALGAEQPFPIQAATIPDVLSGRHVLGRGRTGSGKTIAFGAPLVERILRGRERTTRAMGRAPSALILAPTRELALQIDETVQPIARSVGLFTTQVYGGVPQARQVGALRRGVDIVIGTPGRVEDLVEQGHLDLSQVSIVVLDEADHMTDLGFLEPVRRILGHTRADAQRLLFSATLDAAVAALVEEFLPDPAVHEIAGEDQASSDIEHRMLLIDQRDKIRLVAELAAGGGPVLVFARTRAFAEMLAEELIDAGVPAASLHGDLNQAKRTRNLQRLTDGRVGVLVATDVAARGIHVDGIDLVVQADAPDEYKTYLHRSGRTGRAGRAGTVVTLVPERRRRRVEELLARAEITPQVTRIPSGASLPDDLVAGR